MQQGRRVAFEGVGQHFGAAIGGWSSAYLITCHSLIVSNTEYHQSYEGINQLFRNQ